LKKAFEEPG